MPGRFLFRGDFVSDNSAPHIRAKALTDEITFIAALGALLRPKSSSSAVLRHDRQYQVRRLIS
jgi:hypothetical protein